MLQSPYLCSPPLDSDSLSMGLSSQAGFNAELDSLHGGSAPKVLGTIHFTAQKSQREGTFGSIRS